MYQYYAVHRSPVSLWITDGVLPFKDYTGFGASGTKKSGTSDPAKAVALVSGAANSAVFSSSSIGQFACNMFKQGLESRPFALEAWVLPVPKTTTGDQSILSHNNQFDGLSINGKIVRFGTAYLTTGTAYCTYDLQEYQLAHVVGVHNVDSNQLWVNGYKVAEVAITDAQKADQYIATDSFLYSGYTTSTQELAVGSVGFYPTITSEQIYQNYLAGIDAVPQEQIAPQYDGQVFNMNASQGTLYLQETWSTADDFARARLVNVVYNSEAVTPAYANGTSVAGTWTCSVPLDSQQDTSIYGVMVSWTGSGITVEGSTNGTQWTPLTSGVLASIVPNGFNPTGKDFQVRVRFAGGSTADTSFLESLSIYAWRNNTFLNGTTRTVTASYPAVLRGDYEPNLFRDDNGVDLNGGILTIGTDTTTDPQALRTLELWIKPQSGAPTISVTGTTYRNGIADSTLPVGQWSLVHIVAAANVTTNVTISGDCIIGQVSLYPTALTAANVLNIYKSYTGTPVTRLSESSVIGLTEAATPTTVYAQDWSISAAG